MKISERTIARLALVITGGNELSGYRSGPDLVRFFNELGSNDIYGSGFPSRWQYTEQKIRELNDTPRLVKVFESALDPRDFIGTQFSLEKVVAHLNEFLRYDGYELVSYGGAYRVRDAQGAQVEFDLRSESLSKIDHTFIEEQVKKCDAKVFEGDFAGAITNARSLLEAVLIDIEEKLSNQPVSYDGDLSRLWRRVQRLMSLDPSRKDIDQALRQVLGSLTSTVSGLATLRNKMSDAHGTTYVASKRHAKLAVNAAKTAADFVVEAFLEQMGRTFDSSDGARATHEEVPD